MKEVICLKKNFKNGLSAIKSGFIVVTTCKPPIMLGVQASSNSKPPNNRLHWTGWKSAPSVSVCIVVSRLAVIALQPAPPVKHNRWLDLLKG